VPKKIRTPRIKMIHSSVRLLPIHIKILRDLVNRGYYPDSSHVIRHAIETIAEIKLGRRYLRSLHKR